MRPNEPSARRAFARPLALTTLALYSLYLTGEFLVAGALTSASDIGISALMLAACIAPVAGLTGLVFATSGRLRGVLLVLLLICAAGGAALDAHALHFAAPDGQNAIVVAMVAVWQFVVLILAGAAALVIRRVTRRRSAAAR
ncbi:hypothetical protein [Aurantimonas coralicida]|uniref:hypothetical protein n=1 Tax=Aurantimonas coralicida TaxID=182270 RepID=UPI001D185F17|nr:hypothetical protein [Aurantimonas coralicida]MCC4299638.1 hypothetical protein [Aurantimonas coralicida]